MTWVDARLCKRVCKRLCKVWRCGHVQTRIPTTSDMNASYNDVVAKRPSYQKERDTIDRGRVSPWPQDREPAATVAEAASYTGNPLHKTYPSPAGPPKYSPKADKSKCDRFAEADWPRLRDALRAAIAAPCVDALFRGRFPARAWVMLNGRLHEARLTNQGTGDYHGFPLNYPEHYPDDPDGLLRNAPVVEIPVH